LTQRVKSSHAALPTYSPRQISSRCRARRSKRGAKGGSKRKRSKQRKQRTLVCPGPLKLKFGAFVASGGRYLLQTQSASGLRKVRNERTTQLSSSLRSLVAPLGPNVLPSVSALLATLMTVLHTAARGKERNGRSHCKHQQENLALCEKRVLMIDKVSCRSFTTAAKIWQFVTLL